MASNATIEASVAKVINSRDSVGDLKTVIPTIGREVASLVKSMKYSPAADAAQEFDELSRYAWIDGARNAERQYNSDLPRILSDSERDAVDNIHHLDAHERGILDTPVDPKHPFGLTIGEQIYRTYDTFSGKSDEAVGIELRNRPRKARGRINKITRAKGIIVVSDELMDTSNEIQRERQKLRTDVETPIATGKTRFDEIKAQYVSSMRTLINARRDSGDREEIDPVAPLESAMNNYRASMRKDLWRRVKADLHEIGSSAKGGVVRATKLGVWALATFTGAAAALAPFGVDISGWGIDVGEVNNVSPIIVGATVVGLLATGLGEVEALAKLLTDSVQTVQILRKIGYHKGAQLAEIREIREELKDLLPARKKRFSLTGL